MSVGVVTVAVGDAYQARLPAWARAVADLHRTPDAVTIAVDQIADDLADEIANILPVAEIVESERSWSHHPQILANDAIEHTRTDWICKMDVDDVILPHALDRIDAFDGDVLMFGILHNGRPLIPDTVSAETVLRRVSNHVFSGSPYRRELWEGNPYRDMIFEDWAFWIGCAQRGASFVSLHTVDYIYTTHADQITAQVNEAYWTSVVRSLP